MKGYPIFLNDMHNRKAVVVGGGEEALGKVKGLLAVDAKITVVSSQLHPELRHLVMRSADITWIPREYDTGDLDGAFLVIAERSTPERNAHVNRDAERAGILVNVMDEVDLCNFVAGSVVRSGPLTLAISTSGAAPAYSVRLRQRLEAEFSAEIGEYLTILNQLRRPMAAVHFCFRQRRAKWYALVDSDASEELRAGDRAGFEQQLTEIVGEQVVALWQAGEVPPAAPHHTICTFHCKAPLAAAVCPWEQE